MILVILMFLIGAGAVIGGNVLITRLPAAREARRVNQRLADLSTPLTGEGEASLVKREKSGPLPMLDRFMTDSKTGSGLAKLIDQSGVQTTPSAIIVMSLGIGIVAALATSILVPVPILPLAAFAAGASVPFIYLKFKKSHRLNKFEEQFPEALDLISRALRAGHAFTTGLEMVATEMPAPVGEEFRQLYEQQNYGLSMPDALKRFAERVPVLDARFFVTAVLIQRESGGNLAEVLGNLSSVIRERFRVKRQMRVASAHGRITGWVLVALPPVLGALLMSTNHEHRELMFGERLGIQMMVGAAVLQGIGSLIIRKIVNIPY